MILEESEKNNKNLKQLMDEENSKQNDELKKFIEEANKKLKEENSEDKLIKEEIKRIREELLNNDKNNRVISLSDTSMPLDCDLDTGRCVIYGFDVDGSTPNKEEENALKKIVSLLNEVIVKGNVNVIGHTDHTGSDAYNDILGMKRVTTIVSLLKKFGLKEDIYFRNVESAGKRLPISKGKTSSDRYKNRRVEFYLDGFLLNDKFSK